jgi:hypothetical protein
MNWFELLKLRGPETGGSPEERQRLLDLGYPIHDWVMEEDEEEEEEQPRHDYTKYHLLARSLANTTVVAPTRNHYLIRHRSLPNLGENYGNSLLIHKTDMTEIFRRTQLQQPEPDPNSIFITELLQEDLPDISSPDMALFKAGEAGDEFYKALQIIEPAITPTAFLNFLETYLDLIEPRVIGGKHSLPPLDILNTDPNLTSTERRKRRASPAEIVEPKGLPFDVQDLLDFNEKVLPELKEIITNRLYITDNRILPRFTRRYKTEMSKNVEAKRLFPILAKIIKGESFVGKVVFDDDLIRETEQEITESLNTKIGDRTLYSYLLEAHTKAYPQKGIKALLRRKPEPETGDVIILEERQMDLVQNLDNAVRRERPAQVLSFMEQMKANWEKFGDLVEAGDADDLYKILFGEEEIPEIQTETINVIRDTLNESRERKFRNMGEQLEQLGAQTEEE